MNVVNLHHYYNGDTWGTLELLGIQENCNENKKVSTTVFFLVRTEHASRTLSALRSSLAADFSNCKAIDQAKDGDERVILFTRTVEGKLRKPWRLLQTTASHIEKDYGCIQDAVERQDEFDARWAAREYHEYCWDAPPSMDEPDYPGGPR